MKQKNLKRPSTVSKVMASSRTRYLANRTQEQLATPQQDSPFTSLTNNE